MHLPRYGLGSHIQFIELYPPKIVGGALADITLRRLLCEFLSASLLIVLARNEVNLADQVTAINAIDIYLKLIR